MEINEKNLSSALADVVSEFILGAGKYLTKTLSLYKKLNKSIGKTIYLHTLFYHRIALLY